MNTETQQQIVDIIKQLGERLGTTGEHLWGVLVRQATIEAYTNIAFFIVGLVLWVGLLVASYLLDKEKESFHADKAAFYSILFIGGLFFVLVGTLIIPQSIKAIYNPEFWALKELASMLNK